VSDVEGVAEMRLIPVKSTPTPQPTSTPCCWSGIRRRTSATRPCQRSNTFGLCPVKPLCGLVLDPERHRASHRCNLPDGSGRDWIFIFKHSQGRGFGPVAVEMMMARHPGRILANISPGNDRSRAMFEKIGFTLIQHTLEGPK
jgi:hypothetical protein